MGRFWKAADLARRLVSGIGVAWLTVALVASGYLEPMERWALDRLFELRGARPPAAPIVIVTIDESSNAELNLQWPFPRALHGELIDRISAGRPLAIGIDLIFDTPSARGPEDDEALGRAVARAGNVVLGAAPTVDVQAFYTRVDLNPPLPVIRAGAAAFAPVNLSPDPDSSIRRVPISFTVSDTTLPGFDAALHQVAAAAGLEVASLPVADTVLINFRGGPATYPWVPYYQVVRGEIPSAAFRDTIVLVGPTSEVLHDIFRTPFARGGDMPGVEIHANALETLVRGNAIREAPRWAGALVAVLGALAASLLVVRLHPLRALEATAFVWAVIAAGVAAGFVLADLWVRGMAATLAIGLGYGTTVVENFMREQREKRRLSRFFSPDVLRAVVRGRDEHSLGSSRRTVTVLFSDLRGFTSISEKLEPEQVAEMLRDYLTEMTEIVFKHGGTVDKYIGDCVMALYNVPFEDPQHAIKAVRTGLEFQERTLAAAARWEAKFGVTIRNGVGINTGEAVVGALGSQQRLEYTAIGDTVNLAARLESITKEYGTSIIISESTYAQIGSAFTTRELGDVTVKGKSVPVKIYAVLASDIRKHPRAVLNSVAVLTDVATGLVCHVQTRDIGEGGLALAGVPAGWAVGSRMRIRLEGGALARPLVAEATITWRRGDDAGVSFTALDEESAPAVAEYVATHKGH
ncbi:MAG TPA: CHASE2 domain-containing protein [Candidatus Limnocylindria bacterium]|nr:CHASE2 domain-containing protein [Candidatus Limnocylindria bacterium]